MEYASNQTSFEPPSDRIDVWTTYVAGHVSGSLTLHKRTSHAGEFEKAWRYRAPQKFDATNKARRKISRASSYDNGQLGLWAAYQHGTQPQWGKGKRQHLRVHPAGQ